MQFYVIITSTRRLFSHIILNVAGLLKMLYTIFIKFFKGVGVVGLGQEPIN